MPLLTVMLLLATATLPFALRHAHRGTPHRRVRTGTPDARLPRRALAGMFTAMAAMGTVFGAVQTGVTAWAADAGSPAAGGLVYAEMGVGSALAGAACAWLPVSVTPRVRYAAFSATLALGAGCLPVGDRLGLVPVAVAVAGVTVAPYMVSLYTLTEKLAPPSRAAVAMTVLAAGGPLGTAAGQALAGRLAQHHGSTGAFLVAAAAACGAALLALVLHLADAGRGVWLASPPPRPRPATEPLTPAA